MATWTTLFQRGDAEVTRRLILDRIAPPAGFVLLEADGSPIAVGMGVVERRWVGIFSMATVQEHRRRGAATAVLNALARWGLELGAKDAYLQVEEENEAARSLYERLGFRPAYRYHYRIRRASQTAEGEDR
jgi:GNAT superfamily N-acetyltransferase